MTAVSLPTSPPICNGTTKLFAPGSIPVAIGNTTLVSIPEPAVYSGFPGLVLSWGFLNSTRGTGTSLGDLAYGEFGFDPPTAVTNATDELAFYAASDSVAPPTSDCLSFGYLYQVNS